MPWPEDGLVQAPRETPDDVSDNQIIECEEAVGGADEGKPYEHWATWWAGLSLRRASEGDLKGDNSFSHAEMPIIPNSRKKIAVRE